MYEHKSQPLLSFNLFLLRLLKHFAISISLFLFSLAIGVLGYRIFEGFSWVDAFLNASMILGGMGPVDQISSFDGKLFASFYALFSGMIFTAGTAFVLAPVAHRLLHQLNLEK